MHNVLNTNQVMTSLNIDAVDNILQPSTNKLINKRPKGPVTLTWFSQIHWALWGFFSTKSYTYLALAIMEQFKIPYLYKRELYCLKGCTISTIRLF